MRVVSPGRLEKANLQEHERFFVELWYSMTHMQSLDSYRVKCMNSRTIVRELSEELRIGRADEDELRAIGAEAKKLLDRDPVVKKHFPNHIAILTPFLDKQLISQKPPSKGDTEAAEQRTLFRFAADDFAVALQSTYFSRLCVALKDAMRPGNEDEIRAVLGAFLTDLTDQGWDLGSLYRWHGHFLPQKRLKSYPFSDNLTFMLRQLQRDPQSFEVVLRLSGSERLADIGEFGEFTITETAPIPSHQVTEERFVTPHPLTRFAKTTVSSVDYLPAAMSARESVEMQLDLLRFDYERRVVNIEDGCYVLRTGDGKGKLVQVQLALPNPIENTEREDFDSFVRDVDAACNKACIEEPSRTQLKAAIRQYRFGRDGASYRDMFLNWWMGLEALSRVGKGKSIGPTVTRNVSRLVALNCFFRVLRDLQVTLKYCRIDWPKELSDCAEGVSLDNLTVSQLVSILQSETHRSLLFERCKAYPTLVHRGKWIGEWTTDPKKAVERFKAHLQNVEWHLQRIYRIRCCIVHGAPIRYRLGLITANLEFYLKQTILFALKAFREHNHIGNLDELYARASDTCDRIVKTLEGDSAGPEQLRDAVFADVVTRERETVQLTSGTSLAGIAEQAKEGAQWTQEL